MPADDIASAAVTLRRTHPHAPALDVLDVVFKGRRGQSVTFATPPDPFALLVAEAFDRGMPPDDWAGFFGPLGDLRVRGTLLRIWANEVWPAFLQRYGLST
jgi:hypothetical protein